MVYRLILVLLLLVTWLLAHAIAPDLAMRILRSLVTFLISLL